MLRAYPGAEDAVEKLCKDVTIRRAFHYYMVEAHYCGMFVLQRGKTYYLTRESSIRGTASYELYTWVLYRDNPAGNVDENPKTAYCLYSEKWHDWVTVPHNT